MEYKAITCFFCFEQFEVSLDVGASLLGTSVRFMIVRYVVTRINLIMKFMMER